MNDPRSVTIAIVEEELIGAHAWAARNAWSLGWTPDELRLVASTAHPTGVRVEVAATLDGYRGLPPAWRVVLPGTDDVTAAVFPQPGAGLLGSIFHGNLVLCAPWNRLAYADHGGPHGDWDGPSAWLSVQNTTRATTIGEMLAVIDIHLAASPGMMA